MNYEIIRSPKPVVGIRPHCMMEYEVQTLVQIVYPVRDARRKAPPAKRPKQVRVNPVHERRKAATDFRRRQFYRRRAEALRDLQIREQQAARKAMRRLLEVQKLARKREQEKMKKLNEKRRSPEKKCPLSTCPRKLQLEMRCKVKPGGSRSPTESILTHISKDSIRSRTPIEFGGSCTE